jgi:hypothetical protein
VKLVRTAAFCALLAATSAAGIAANPLACTVLSNEEIKAALGRKNFRHRSRARLQAATVTAFLAAEPATTSAVATGGRDCGMLQDVDR